MIQKMTKGDEGKISAAMKALDFVKSGMTLGLGTGSTIRYFVEFLAEKKLDIQACATSIQTEKLCLTLGIPLLDPEKITHVDLAIDGADEIDPQGTMIKGGGGALLREKISAKMAGGLTVIVDETKRVQKLGKHPLPVEILPWGKLATEKELNKKGFYGQWRENVLSDNGNALFDIHFKDLISNPLEIDSQISSIPGVLATGFFFGLASRVIVGYLEGKVEIYDI